MLNRYRLNSCKITPLVLARSSGGNEFIAARSGSNGIRIEDAWLESPWLFSFLWCGAWGRQCVGIGGAFSEYRKLKRLKQVADTQETGARLAQSMQMGEADSFIDNIVCHYGDSQGLQQLAAH